MAVSDNIPDDDQTPSKQVTLQGFERKLSTGATVWLAEVPPEYGHGFAMHFTSKDGEKTKLCLSTEAMEALLGLHRSITERESLAYRLMVRFVDRVGGKATEVLSSTWERIDPSEVKEPPRE